LSNQETNNVSLLPTLPQSYALWEWISLKQSIASPLNWLPGYYYI